MNFHPKAMERQYRGHKDAWLDEPTYNAVAKIKAAHAAGTYKGNAEAAVADILAKAHKAGAAGQGNAAYWAWWICTVCRSMAWYDWGAQVAALPEADRPKAMAHMGEVPTGAGVAV